MRLSLWCRSIFNNFFLKFHSETGWDLFEFYHGLLRPNWSCLRVATASNVHLSLFV